MLLPLLGGCATEGQAVSYLALVLTEGEYRVEPRDVGTLSDLGRVGGALAVVTTGGRVEVDDDDIRLIGGRPVDVGYEVQGGVAVPLDRAGMVLWSFYGHVEDMVADLADLDLDPDGLVPFKAAWTPVIPDLFLELLPKENAAYATGAHFFILLDDLVQKDVPLAANAGIVRHEIGHAVFHRLVTGGVKAPSPFGITEESAAALYYSSLHEAYADMLASLTLDDPTFFEPSLSMPERDVSGRHRAGDVTLPEEHLARQGDSFLDFYDPYPLGTVFAATAWDLRLALGDPGETLSLLTEGVRLWASAGEAGDAWGLLDAWVEVADGDARAVLCASLDQRFAGVHHSGGCP